MSKRVEAEEYAAKLMLIKLNLLQTGKSDGPVAMVTIPRQSGSHGDAAAAAHTDRVLQGKTGDVFMSFQCLLCDHFGLTQDWECASP